MLEREAAQLRPGESGLLALDWWNGNRSILVDAELSGLLVGATLATRPPEIYRALLEATAFGTRVIIEAFEAAGVAVDAIVACGGLPERNRLLMQIFADVTGREFARRRVEPDAGARARRCSARSRRARQRAATTRSRRPSRAMARLGDERYVPNPANTLSTTSSTPSTCASTTCSGAAATTQ